MTDQTSKPKIQNPLSSLEFTDEDRELFSKLTLLFSKVKNKPLRIYFHENSKKHYITLNKSQDVYEIHTDPLDQMLDTKTAFEHEASHYLFNSPLKTLKKYLFEILGSDYSPELKNKHIKAIKSVFNILEDIRIESLYSQINLGSKSRFNKVKNLYGLRDLAPRKEIKDPITALFCVRFNQKNKLKKSGKYPEALTLGKQAENLDEKGIILIVKKYYDLYVREYIESKKQDLDMDRLMQSQTQTQEPQEEEKEDEEETDEDSDPNPNADQQEPQDEDEDEETDEDSDTNPDTEDRLQDEDEDEDEETDEDSDGNSEKLSDLMNKKGSNIQESIGDGSTTKNRKYDDEDLKNDLRDKYPNLTESELDKLIDILNDNQDDKEKLSEIEQNIKDQLEERKEEEDEEKEFNDMLDEHEDEESEFNNEFEEEKENKIDLDLTESELKDELEKSEKRKDKKVKDIEKKFKDISKQKEHTIKRFLDPKVSPFKETDITNRDYIYNHKIESDQILLKNLTKVFLKAKGKPRIRPDEIGHEISIPDYLISKVDPNHKELFKQYKKDQSLTIYFLIDQSGSMSSNLEETCRLLKTFYESANKLRKVKILTKGYAGGDYQNGKINVSTITVKSLKDLGKMNNTHGMTPTQYALQIAHKDLKKISGNKLLIVFTDGDPNCMIEKQGNQIRSCDNSTQGRKETIEFNRFLIKEMQKDKIVSFGVMLGDNRQEALMQEVFNKNYSVCEDIEEARIKLTKVFQKTILDFLNRT